MGDVIQFRRRESGPIIEREFPCPVIDFDYFQLTGKHFVHPPVTVQDMAEAQRKLRDRELLKFFEGALEDAVSETDRILANINAMIADEQAAGRTI